MILLNTTTILPILDSDRLVALEGPGGGNPVVQFRGTEQNLRALLVHWEFDEDDIEYFLFGE